MSKDSLNMLASNCNPSRKRKMKEIIGPSYPAPPPQFSASPPLHPGHLDTGRRFTGPEQCGGSDLDLLHRPIKSYTSLLLNGEDSEIATHQLQQDYLIKQTVKPYSDHVRDMLEEMCRLQCATAMAAAEERSTKRLKEKDEAIARLVGSNAEMKRTLDMYFYFMKRVYLRKKALEKKNATLQAALRETTRRGFGEGNDDAVMPWWLLDEDVASSSSVDPTP